MRLSPKGLAIAGAALWGGGILLVGLANLVWEGYGLAFLELAASIYPGFNVEGGLGQVIVGTVYGAADGAVAGLIVAFVYNACAGGARPDDAVRA